MDRGSPDQAAHRRDRDHLAGRSSRRLSRRRPALPPWWRRHRPAPRLSHGDGSRRQRRGGSLGAFVVAAAWQRAGRSGERRRLGGRHGRRGRPAVRASLHVAERRLVGPPGTGSGTRRPRRPRAATAWPRRRLPRRARAVRDARGGRSHRAQARPPLLDLPTRSVTSPRQLPLSRLGHLIPPLVESQALVALVPTTADLVWAAKAAWDIARIAARGGRRVALVDLGVEEPALHQTVGLTPSDGIVDAFEYGVSLSKAAQEIDGVFFIAAGSYTASVGDLYAHPRWRKLQAGFRSEGALLLLFVSATGLGKLSAVADGAIVLAPEGLDPASAVGLEIAAVVERGTPVLGVARDRWMPTPGAVPAFESPPPEPGRRRRGARAAMATLVLAGAAVGGWALFAPARELLRTASEPTPSAPPPTP